MLKSKAEKGFRNEIKTNHRMALTDGRTDRQLPCYTRAGYACAYADTSCMLTALYASTCT